MNIDNWIDIIKSFSKLKKDWDSYGAEPISQESINCACNFVDYMFAMHQVLPIQAGPFPDMDGGVTIIYGPKENYHWIDVYDGDILVHVHGTESVLEYTRNDFALLGSKIIIKQIEQHEQAGN